MSKDKIPLKGGAEHDALSKARKWYKYLDRPGVVKKIKRQYNRRFRQNGKKQIESGRKELE